MIFPALLAAAITMAVQPDTGALTLALDGKPVITGTLAQDKLKVAHTSARQDSPAHATVQVDYTDGASAVYTYALAGRDCTLDYALTNAASQPRTIDLSGWTCAFDPAATLKGTMPYWHVSFYVNRAVWHPGVFSPLGAVYATDGHVATVFYSPSEWGRQSLINATFSLALHLPNPIPLEFHTDRQVTPGTTDHASLVMRVTDDLGQDGLHGGFKAFLAQKYPALLYVPDPRPAAMFSSVDKAFSKPGNPGGYNGDGRRIDRPEGVEAFLHWLGDPLQTLGAQGCIFWAPGGWDPVMYPPDFDTNLARIADTWKTLAAGLHARGLRAGLCARAAETIDRSSPDASQTRFINPDDHQQVETLLARFHHAASLGVDAYYLDTFGNTWDSTRLLPAIRETVGPAVPLYLEYCSDATLPYADRYCEYTRGDGVSWDSAEQLAALRYLFPRSVWLCVSRTNDPWPENLARLGLTPLIQDFQVKDVLAKHPPR